MHPAYLPGSEAKPNITYQAEPHTRELVAALFHLL